jgi:hypothetical protein
VVSVTDPYGRILSFLDRSRYFWLRALSLVYSKLKFVAENVFGWRFEGVTGVQDKVAHVL